MRKRQKSLAVLTRELDRVFSEFIRKRDKGVCFTCGKKLFWRKQQNGHYVSRAHRSLRWDERNCHCQCVGCNIFKNGNMDVYAINLIRKYGQGILEELAIKKSQIVKLSTLDLERMIKYYKGK